MIERASFGSWLLGSFWGGLPVRRGGCLENSEKRMGQSMLRCAELGFALLRISPGAVCIKRLRLYAWGIYSSARAGLQPFLRPNRSLQVILLINTLAPNTQ